MGSGRPRLLPGIFRLIAFLRRYVGSSSSPLNNRLIPRKRGDWLGVLHFIIFCDRSCFLGRVILLVIHGRRYVIERHPLERQEPYDPQGDQKERESRGAGKVPSDKERLSFAIANDLFRDFLRHGFLPVAESRNKGIVAQDVE